jgi:hypothetical protein
MKKGALVALQKSAQVTAVPILDQAVTGRVSIPWPGSPQSYSFRSMTQAQYKMNSRCISDPTAFSALDDGHTRCAEGLGTSKNH